MNYDSFNSTSQSNLGNIYLHSNPFTKSYSIVLAFRHLVCIYTESGLQNAAGIRDAEEMREEAVKKNENQSNKRLEISQPLIAIIIP